jgi:hypothetical protein
MEQKNILLNEENEKILREYNDIEIKFRIAHEKEKYTNDRIKNFENYELEYQHILDELKSKKKSWIEKEYLYVNEIKNLKNKITTLENTIDDVL